MSANLASGISARLLAGNSGAETGVSGVGRPAGGRLIVQIIPPASSARASHNGRNRNARRLLASSSGSRDGSVDSGSDWFIRRVGSPNTKAQGEFRRGRSNSTELVL